MEKGTSHGSDQPPPYSSVESPYPGVHQPYVQQGFPEPPPGYQAQPTAPIITGFPTYGATHTTTVVVEPPIFVVGACPACRIGILEDDYTCLGVLCAIFFFPLGILCCLALKNRRCSVCGASFG